MEFHLCLVNHYHLNISRWCFHGVIQQTQNVILCHVRDTYVDCKGKEVEKIIYVYIVVIVRPIYLT
jgi:hypothetical protein